MEKIKKIHLDIVFDDNLNCIEIDSVDKKYVTHQIIDEKLIFNYDYYKDYQDIADSEKRSYVKTKYIKLYLNNPIYKIYTKETELNLSLIDDSTFLNDLSIECIASELTLLAPYLKTKGVFYDFNYKLNMKLSQNSQVNFSHFKRIKELNLELKECRNIRTDVFTCHGRRKSEEIDIPTFNLSIDKMSKFMMDVNELRKVNINYIEE